MARTPDPGESDRNAAVQAAPPLHEPAPPGDAGEPMGAKDRARPAMLGSRFRLTMGAGMLAGLVIALAGHALLDTVWIARDSNGWGWLLTVIGGIAVGGALTLFLYGVSTDRTDTGPKRRGRADVTTEGEERRTRRRHGRPRA